MSVPDFKSLMLPLLEMSSFDETSIADIIEKLAARLQLTPAERAELLPSGKQAMFNNRVHWAKFHLGKAGLLENRRRGYFRITELGTKTLAAKPIRIDLNYLSRFEQFRKFREKSAAVADADLASGAAEVRRSDTDAGRGNAVSSQANRQHACARPFRSNPCGAAKLF